MCDMPSHVKPGSHMAQELVLPKIVIYRASVPTGEHDCALATQAVTADEPAGENDPAGHALHAVLFELAPTIEVSWYVFASHSAHVDIPLASTNEPAAHT